MSTVSTKPATTNLVTTNPVDADSVTTNLATTNLATTNLATTNLATTKLATTNLATTNLASVTTAPLATVPGIGLVELDAAAALQTRVDRKYVLTVAETRGLLAALAPTARILQIGGVRDFRYASTYFDTPDLETYRLAAYRRRRRYKVRTRTYVDTGARFLEVKTRAARGVTVKHRTAHDHESALGRGCGFVADELAAAGVVGVEPGRLAPVLATRYHRTTLLLPDARVTVDTGLVWTLLAPRCEAPVEAAFADVAIVETKTGSAPSSTDRLLWRAQHRPDRISKYATGLAVLRPDLPDTPWRRTLRRHPVALLHDERTFR